MFDTQSVRLEEMNFILRHCDFEIPFCLCGDLNENDDCMSIAMLCERGLTDALFLTDKMTHHFRIRELDESPTIWKRLDRLFCNRCVPIQVSVFDDEFGSDHFLVHATIEL